VLAGVLGASRSVKVFFNNSPTVLALVKLDIIIFKLVNSTAQVPVCVPKLFQLEPLTQLFLKLLYLRSIRTMV
jgi:hypothetical protein